MDSNVRCELEEFLEFKKNYKFVEKEIIEENDSLFCDGEYLGDLDNVVGESDKWINVGFKNKGLSRTLSNLFPYEFTFRGCKFSSIEGFFQGIKFPDKDMQKLIFSYSGIDAVYIKLATSYNWRESGIIYFQGEGINRFSDDYELLIDELYISAVQNPIYRNMLLNCDKYIIHSIGEVDKKLTTFTRYEFERELNCLKDFLKQKEKSLT